MPPTSAKDERGQEAADATDTTPSPEPKCRMLADSLSLESQITQLFMMGVTKTGLTEAQTKAMQESQPGSVVLLGSGKVTANSVRSLTRSFAQYATDQIPVLVAVDQEGGMVQRLSGPGFSTIPSASKQANLEDGRLHADALTWGQELAEAGVLFNLAPVADVVPADMTKMNAPIGRLQRGYGSDPKVVSGKVREFIGGMREAGVATSVKHFPGLGRVKANTDFGRAYDSVTTLNEADLWTFSAGIHAGVSSVMLSSAVYDKIDPGVPSVFSSTLITKQLRQTWGYQGVVISDDLGAAESVTSIPPGERAVRFLAAGGDLVINADPKVQATMMAAVRAKAEADPEFKGRIAQSAARVLALKESVGTVNCTAVG